MRQYVTEFIKKFRMELYPSDKQAKQKLNDHVHIFMMEEMGELIRALELEDAEEIVDALGDISWHCDKAMIMLGIDPDRVRERIGIANLEKMPGIKPGRENAVIDVVKPEGWKAPDHSDNHGRLDEVLNS